MSGELEEMPLQAPLNGFQRSGAVREPVGLDAQTLQHGDKEIRQRDVLVSDLLLPRFSAAVPGAARRVVARVVEILAVLEPHVLSTGQDQRVVAREMEGTRGGTEQDKRVVQNVALAGGLGSRVQLAE